METLPKHHASQVHQTPISRPRRSIRVDDGLLLHAVDREDGFLVHNVFGRRGGVWKEWCFLRRDSIADLFGPTQVEEVTGGVRLLRQVDETEETADDAD